MSMSTSKNVMTFCIFVIFCLGLSNYAVNGELNTNKPSANVVQRTHVDRVDCVDIYKQPAFDHPKLKNHKIQMEPSFTLERKLTKASTNAAHSTLIPHRGCPPGKVPILRSNVKDRPKISNVKNRPFQPRQHVVIFQNRPNRSTYHGVAARINIQNPRVGPDQYSAGQIWVQNGPQTELNVIQAGWAVNAELYDDSLTHATTLWIAEGYETGCYNADCPGFVQVHHEFHPGAVFQNISIYGGEQYVTEFAILQDESSGNWWFIVDNEIKIGYWPKEIFSHLQAGATVIRYGGLAQQSPAGESPEMGNGRYPVADFEKSSYFQWLQNAQDEYLLKFVGPDDIIGDIDTTGCYGFIYLGNHDEVTGPAFTYGGPGGWDCGV